VASEDQVYSNLGPEHAHATCFRGTTQDGDLTLKFSTLQRTLIYCPTQSMAKSREKGRKAKPIRHISYGKTWRPRLRAVHTVCGTIDRRFKLSYSLARILVRKQALKGLSERASLIHERCQRMYGGVERFKAVVDCSPNFDVLISG
jgi:hypothetical protein